jgi:hypothetical protein
MSIINIQFSNSCNTGVAFLHGRVSVFYDKEIFEIGGLLAKDRR